MVRPARGDVLRMTARTGCTEWKRGGNLLSAGSTSGSATTPSGCGLVILLVTGQHVVRRYHVYGSLPPELER